MTYELYACEDEVSELHKQLSDRTSWLVMVLEAKLLPICCVVSTVLARQL